MEKQVNKFLAVTAKEVLRTRTSPKDDRFFDAVGTWEIPAGWDALQTTPEASADGLEACVDMTNLKVMVYSPSSEESPEGSVIQVYARNRSDFFEILAGLAEEEIIPYPQYSFIPKAN